MNLKENEIIIQDSKGDNWKCKRITDPTLHDWEGDELLWANQQWWQKLQKLNLQNNAS